MCAMGGHKRKRGGGRGNRGSGSDYTSDEEFELGEGDEYDATSEEEETGDSDAFSDASNEDSDDRPDSSSGDSEVEDNDDEDFVVANLKTRKIKEIRNKPVAKKKSLDMFGEEERLSRRKPRGRWWRWPNAAVLDEEEDEYEDDSDEDFSPDEEENEEVLEITIRKKIVRRKGGPGKKRGRKKRNSNSVELVDEDEEEEEREKIYKRRRKRRGTGPKPNAAKGKGEVMKRKRRRKKKKKTVSSPVKKRGRRRALPTSDDENDRDFILKDRVPVRRRSNGAGSRKSSNVRKRRKQESDFSDSDSSDFEYNVSEHELGDLPVVNANCRKRRTGRVSEKEKGKGKEIEDSSKQVCGICLSEEHRGIARGLLNSCTHFFCFSCIMEWSKVESRCPVCKQRFTTISKILVSNAIPGLRPTVVRVPKRDQVYQPSEEELWGFLNPYENVVCMECLQGGDDHLMLLCDLCDSPAHTYCVGLGREVPEGDWYCNGCRSADRELLNSQVRDPQNGRISNNGELLPRQYRNRNTREAFAAGVPSYATPDRSASLHEILEQSIPRVSDFGLSSPISSAENNGIARTSGPSALTLYGRRALSHRIRILFSNSNNRVRLVSPQSPGVNVARSGPLGGDAGNSEIGQRRRTILHRELSPEYNGQRQRSGLHNLGLNSPLMPHTSYDESHL